MERLYKELGLESLCDRRWYCKLVFFYKIVKVLGPSYLQSYLLPDNERTYSTMSSLPNTIKTLATWTSDFCATFFLYCTKEWNQLNDDIKKIESIKKLKIKKKTLIKIIRTKENSVFQVSDIYGIKLLTHSRLNFSHLNEHKFRHNFIDRINLMYNCGANTEATIHYLLCCRIYSVQKNFISLFDDIYILNSTLPNYSEHQ